MKASDTLGAQVKRAWRPPSSARFSGWLDKMGSSRAKPLSREAVAQRKYDARAVAKMRKRVKQHNATVRREACRA